MNHGAMFSPAAARGPHNDRRRLRLAASFTWAAFALVLTLAAGCGGGPQVGGTTTGGTGVTPAGGTEAPPAPRALTAEDLLDRAADRWAGTAGTPGSGRQRLAEETGFHIQGKVTEFIDGREQPGEVEVWMRYQPFGNRESVRRVLVHPSGEERSGGETLKLVDGEEAWGLNLATKNLEPAPGVAQAARSQPTPRKLLLHREHHLTVQLTGEDELAELDGIKVHSILTRDPSGRDVWAYVDHDFNLRKITFKSDLGSWVSSTFESFRPVGATAGAKTLSKLERASFYEKNVKKATYVWGERESSPVLPESLFRP